MAVARATRRKWPGGRPTGRATRQSDRRVPEAPRTGRGPRGNSRPARGTRDRRGGQRGPPSPGRRARAPGTRGCGRSPRGRISSGRPGVHRIVSCLRGQRSLCRPAVVVGPDGTRSGTGPARRPRRAAAGRGGRSASPVQVERAVRREDAVDRAMRAARGEVRVEVRRRPTQSPTRPPRDSRPRNPRRVRPRPVRIGASRRVRPSRTAGRRRRGRPAVGERVEHGQVVRLDHRARLPAARTAPSAASASSSSGGMGVSVRRSPGRSPGTRQ